MAEIPFCEMADLAKIKEDYQMRFRAYKRRLHHQTVWHKQTTSKGQDRSRINPRED